MYIYIYIYICMYTLIYINMHSKNYLPKQKLHWKNLNRQGRLYSRLLNAIEERSKKIWAQSTVNKTKDWRVFKSWKRNCRPSVSANYLYPKGKLYLRVNVLWSSRQEVVVQLYARRLLKLGFYPLEAMGDGVLFAMIITLQRYDSKVFEKDNLRK